MTPLSFQTRFAPRGTADGLRALEMPCLFASVYALLSLFRVPQIPFMLPLAVGILLLPAVSASRRLHSVQYRRSWNIASALFIVGVVLYQIRVSFPPHAVLALICLFLTLHKWSVPRAAREHVELWCLSILMLMTGALKGSGLFSIIVQIGWAISSLHLLNLLAVISTRGGIPGGEQRPYSFAPASLRSAFHLLPLFLIVTGVVLFLAPRLKIAAVADPPQSSLGTLGHAAVQAGFSESVNLRSLTAIQQSNAVAFRVISPPADINPQLLRFRVSTLDEFDGWQWTRSSRVREAAPALIPPGVIFPDNSVPAGPLDALFIRLSDFPGNMVPLPPNAVSLDGFPTDVFASMEDDGRLVFNQRRPPREYTIMVRRAAGAQGVLRGAVLESHRHVPEGTSAAAAAVAAQISAGRIGASTLDKARAAEGWFRRNGVYTLDLDYPEGGPQAISRFLTGGLHGHCELFATAMALVMREQGIPSRLVTGFAGSEPAPAGLLVLHRHAHAWVEVWDETHGWTAFDPTPPPPLSPAAERLAGSHWTRALSTQATHLSGILDGYDYEAQRRMRAKLRNALDRFVGEWEHGAGVRAWQRIAGNASQTPVLLLTAFLLALNLVAWSVHRRWRLPHRTRATTGMPAAPQREVPRLLRDILVALGAGLPVSAVVSPREVILAAAQQRRLEPMVGVQLAELYTRWRYQGARDELERDIRRLLRQVRRSSS